MAKPKIHFVCLGNAFRSRLAEAYAKSLGLKNIEFSSSGTAAHLFEQRVPRLAEQVAHQQGVAKFLSKGQQQTTGKLLSKQDMVIFMSPDVMAQAMQMYSFEPKKCLCWHVNDLWQDQLKTHTKPSQTAANLRLVAATFNKINHNVDQLAKEISGPLWVGIVDQFDKPLNFTWPISLANKHKLWTRGVRVLMQTTDDKFVAEKRSSSVIFARGLLDLTLGGYVDAYEDPLKAAIRETFEETGIKLEPSQLKFLQVYKGSHYHPKYRRTTRGFVHCYFARLKPNQQNFKVQQSEVAEILFLSPRQAKSLIRRHYLKNFGRLNYLYKLYAQLLSLALK